ncbi:MAG: phytanoyl-CoA dioxygenase family protein, partial [Alphaproteobacteria bacterium]|nr:phytanoyl-CoA dioxygenase family protein [Alphaproteobacteria bacterium]
MALADVYARDGFVCPLDIMSTEEAEAVRADLEAAERELADDPQRLGLLHSYPDRLLPSFDRMIRHPRMVAAAQQVLGPDLLVWSAALFIKEPQSPHIVSWHQDLTYWGLDDAEEITCWVALSPATEESGCMRFVPGSHRKRAVPHIDTFADNNLLTRGQEIAVDVDEAETVLAELQTGQMSMHHGHMFHASGPNTTQDRRIASAIRYIKPTMKQQTDFKPIVSLVSGEDNFGNFTVLAPPKDRLSDEEFVICQRDSEAKRDVLYAGADSEAI